jgi:hypothetical protein
MLHGMGDLFIFHHKKIMTSSPLVELLLPELLHHEVLPHLDAASRHCLGLTCRHFATSVLPGNPRLTMKQFIKQAPLPYVKSFLLAADAVPPSNLFFGHTSFFVDVQYGTRSKDLLATAAKWFGRNGWHHGTDTTPLEWFCNRLVPSVDARVDPSEVEQHLLLGLVRGGHDALIDVWTNTWSVPCLVSLGIRTSVRACLKRDDYATLWPLPASTRVLTSFLTPLLEQEYLGYFLNCLETPLQTLRFFHWIKKDERLYDTACGVVGAHALSQRFIPRGFAWPFVLLHAVDRLEPPNVLPPMTPMACRDLVQSAISLNSKKGTTVQLQACLDLLPVDSFTAQDAWYSLWQAAVTLSPYRSSRQKVLQAWAVLWPRFIRPGLDTLTLSYMRVFDMCYFLATHYPNLNESIHTSFATLPAADRTRPIAHTFLRACDDARMRPESTTWERA